MMTRFLSVCLAAAMMFGVAAEAWAQASSRSGRRPQSADDAPATANRNEATASEPGSSSGASQDSNAKDPFDAAEAKAKGTASKSGSPGDSTEPKLEKATFGAGCFWHVEAEFEWLPGVQVGRLGVCRRPCGQPVLRDGARGGYRSCRGRAGRV